MRLSVIVTLAIALLANKNKGGDAFRVTPDNNDLMKKSVEDAILTEIKPLHTTGGGIDLAPPVRNQILGTEVPVSTYLLLYHVTYRIYILIRLVSVCIYPLSTCTCTIFAPWFFTIYSLNGNTGHVLTFTRLVTLDLGVQSTLPWHHLPPR